MVSNIFIFTRILGEDFQFDKHIFQMVWFNYNYRNSNPYKWPYNKWVTGVISPVIVELWAPTYNQPEINNHWKKWGSHQFGRLSLTSCWVISLPMTPMWPLLGSRWGRQRGGVIDPTSQDQKPPISVASWKENGTPAMQGNLGWWNIILWSDWCLKKQELK